MLKDIHNFVTAIAPELKDHRLHVVDLDATDLAHTDGGGLAEQCSTENWARADDWQHGDAILAIRVADYPEPEKLRAIAIHELSHLLPLPTKSQQEYRAARGSLSVAKVEENWTDSGDASPSCVITHHTGFIQNCVHLWARAMRRAAAVDHDAILGYGWLSPLKSYLPLFYRETVAYPDATFDELAKLPLPIGVSDLWARDVETFHKVYGEPANV